MIIGIIYISALVILCVIALVAMSNASLPLSELRDSYGESCKKKKSKKIIR